MPPSKLFNKDGVLLFEKDLKYISSGEIVYLAMRGEDFNYCAILDDYELIRTLGEGGFGEVLLMIRKSDGKEVVLKKSHKRMSGMSVKERDQAISEAILTVRLGKEGSAFLIKGYEAFMTPDEHICIVLEYAQQGSLKSILN